MAEGLGEIGDPGKRLNQLPVSGENQERGQTQTVVRGAGRQEKIGPVKLKDRGGEKGKKEKTKQWKEEGISKEAQREKTQRRVSKKAQSLEQNPLERPSCLNPHRQEQPSMC